MSLHNVGRGEKIEPANIRKALVGIVRDLRDTEGESFLATDTGMARTLYETLTPVWEKSASPRDIVASLDDLALTPGRIGTAIGQIRQSFERSVSGDSLRSLREGLSSRMIALIQDAPIADEMKEYAVARLENTDVMNGLSSKTLRAFVDDVLEKASDSSQDPEGDADLLQTLMQNQIDSTNVAQSAPARTESAPTRRYSAPSWSSQRVRP